MIVFYKIFWFVLYFFTLPFTYLRHLSGSFKWSTRLGFKHGNDVKRKKRYDIWLHAASMGEVMVLKILTDQLKKINESVSMYITVITENGYKRATELFGKDDIGYLPLDYDRPIKRFLRRINPRVSIIIETEIWPNLIMQIGKASIPLFLANGRLTEESFNKYHKIRGTLKNIFANYSEIMVQTQTDKERFEKIGADPDKIKIMGSLKFDAPAIQISENKKRMLVEKIHIKKGNRLFIAGSIRNDEFDKIISMFAGLSREQSDVKMIFVPRYLDRINELTQSIEDNDLTFRLYSNPQNNVNATYDILVVDKMGILNDLYAVSDMAFVGGTFDGMGGHNILEPVWAGIPVLYGPSIENVKESADYIDENNYGEMVTDVRDLRTKLIRFFDGDLEFKRKSAGNNNAVRSARTAQIIMKSLQ